MSCSFPAKEHLEFLLEVSDKRNAAARLGLEASRAGYLVTCRAFWKGAAGGGSGTCTRWALAGQPSPALCTPNPFEGLVLRAGPLLLLASSLAFLSEMTKHSENRLLDFLCEVFGVENCQKAL